MDTVDHQYNRKLKFVHRYSKLVLIYINVRRLKLQKFFACTGKNNFLNWLYDSSN